MRSKIARLFTIKTRFEAWLVIYAIAMGAVERGQHYLEIYPGTFGWVLAALCTGVVFLAGAKLLDSVTPARATATAAAVHSVAPTRRHRLNRNRPRQRPLHSGLGSPISLRKD
ncbi:hypothetical protein [Sphingomonas sp.]|uniref:hypothetical protein n=1 Tax=Sphingomonas sp. TaxID=28214 RepID=UPI00286E3127|nr:hypothetical protein [Sphingomonas sp.]